MIGTPLSARPSIWDVPCPTPQRDNDFIKRFVASAELLILELLLLYPHRDIFFIARDMEYHYDLAAVMFRDEPELLKRFHLVNISRISMHDPMLPEYCKQAIFDRCERVLLVDSGFNGNVIAHIRRSFPDMDIKGHLIYSENPAYSSSHAAMEALGIPCDELPADRKKHIEDVVEHLPHFASKAVSYRRDGGRIVPVHRPAQDAREWERQSIDFLGQLRDATIAYDLANSWREKYRLLDRLLTRLSYRIPRHTVLEVDFRYLYPSFGPTAASLREPLGIGDFLRRIKALSESNRFECRFIHQAQPVDEEQPPAEWDSFTRALRRYGVSFAGKDACPDPNRSVVKAPDRTEGWGKDYQFDFKKIWRLVEAECPQPPVDAEQLRQSVLPLLSMPGGIGFIRDVLENASTNHYGLYFREEIIGRVWGIIADGLAGTVDAR